MAKSKYDPELCMKHLDTAEREELPKVIWKYLLACTGGTKESVYFLTKKKIQDLAFDFLDSGPGRSYWPLSDQLGQWQYEASTDQTKQFIADIMAREQKEHTAKDPTFLVDLDTSKKTSPKTTPSKGTKQTPAKNVSRQSKASLLGKPSTPFSARSGAKKKVVTPSFSDGQATSKTTSFSQESYQSIADRSKSPADIHYDSSPAKATLKRPLRPTRASEQVAFGKAEREAEADFLDMESVNSTIIHQATAPGSTKQDQGGPSGTKRSADDQDVYSDDDGVRTPSTPVHVNKRLAVASPALVAQGQPRLGLGISVPPRAEQQQAPLTMDPKESPGVLVSACGHRFTIENLAKLPEVLLEYIEECEAENLRSLDASEAEVHRNHFQFRAKVFQELQTDLESRVKYMAADGPARRRVEKNYSLLSSRST